MIDFERIAAYEQEDRHEKQRAEALLELATIYLDEDNRLFLEEMDDEADRIGYVYGRILESGDDPDVVLAEYGVIDERSED